MLILFLIYIRHPAFEEDEIQLIILGGILGAIVGVAQLYGMFDGTWF